MFTKINQSFKNQEKVEAEAHGLEKKLLENYESKNISQIIHFTIAILLLILKIILLRSSNIVLLKKPYFIVSSLPKNRITLKFFSFDKYK